MANRVLSAGSITTEFQLPLFIDQIGKIRSPAASLSLCVEILSLARRSKDSSAWIFRRRTPGGVDRFFRRGQLFSAGLYSLGHGGADAQKTMGIIAAVLVAGNLNPTATTHIPLWVVLSCHAAMAIGTLLGGWRIVKTMGQRITKLKPVGGFAAETAGGLTLI